jgi:hypothetical protein
VAEKLHCYAKKQADRHFASLERRLMVATLRGRLD